MLNQDNIVSHGQSTLDEDGSGLVTVLLPNSARSDIMPQEALDVVVVAGKDELNQVLLPAVKDSLPEPGPSFPEFSAKMRDAQPRSFLAFGIKEDQLVCGLFDSVLLGRWETLQRPPEGGLKFKAHAGL